MSYQILRTSAVLTALAAVAMAFGQSAAQRSLAIKVTVDPYVALSIDRPNVEIRTTAGSGTFSGSTPFRVASNGNFRVSVTQVAKPSSYHGPGVFTAFTDYSTGAAGEETVGTLTVQVTGVVWTDNAGNFANGTVTLTVTQP